MKCYTDNIIRALLNRIAVITLDDLTVEQEGEESARLRITRQLNKIKREQQLCAE